MTKTTIVLLLLLFGFVSKAQTETTPQMKPLNYQIGKWLATEVRTDKDGRKQQFGYELQWFDSKKSIAKMTITGVYEDGEIRTYWEGFKNWDANENRILYNGFSVNGRVAKGYLEQVSDRVMNTLYSGIDPQGNPVEIKDIATKIDASHHTSETYLKREGKDWMKINTDNWVKVESQQFNEQLK